MWIELQDIHKYYGSVRANNGVDLKVAPGTIHGILGENGAGKSTLMKILAGYCRKTRGEIYLDGAAVNYQTPAQAADLGIGMLYQDPLDFPHLTALDNFMLGQTGGVVNRNKSYKNKFVNLSKSFNFSLRPDSSVKRLTIGERQQLEILRLLSLGIRILILDEPTTGISSIQKELLFDALKKLTSEGKSVILVSHKLEDVEALCDWVTVLRQGVVTGSMAAPFDTAGLLEMMFGKPPAPPSRTRMVPGKPILALTHVQFSGGRTGLRDCDVVVRQGEVVGLAGLEGSGQGVLLRLAAGLIKPQRGTLQLVGKETKREDYHSFRRKGVAFLPSARLEEGLIAGLNVTEHFALQKNHVGFFVRWPQATKRAKQRIDDFRIKGAPETPVESLSGGNQQRLLLSFLPSDPILLLLENPTRGLDMESVHWVWQHLHRYCASNTSIIFSSAELDEILMVADRVLVFFNGSIIKDVRTDETDINELGRAIAGKV
ncbi:MAG: ATP-binding cassette domain-containing protein [Deltaproteobacteria bacterium]|nr:MAG: ATP-binding cassette domain-containing protein [Deltaproteobacteria bacterium]